MPRDSTSVGQQRQQSACSFVDALRINQQHLAKLVVIGVAACGLELGHATPKGPATPPREHALELVQLVGVEWVRRKCELSFGDLAQVHAQPAGEGVELCAPGQLQAVPPGQPGQEQRVGNAEQPPRWFVEWESRHWLTCQLPVYWLCAIAVGLLLGRLMA